MKKRVLLVIPTFHCAQQISRVLTKLSNEREHLVEIERVLVIDNQSSDETASTAERVVRTHNLDDWVWVVQNSANYGLGGTHKSAFHWAIANGFTHAIVFHGDDQGEVRQIRPLLTLLLNGRDAVLGSRFSRGSKRVGYSKARIFGNLVLNALSTALLFRKVSDLGSGLNGFRLAAFDQEFHFFSDGFTFNLDALLSLIGKNADFHFFPIIWKEEDQVSNARNFKVASAMLMTLLKWRFRRRDPEPRLTSVHTNTNATIELATDSNHGPKSVYVFRRYSV